MLALECHLPLVNLVHLLQLVFNDNCLIDQVLESFIICIEQLELDVVIESVEKHALFLLICIDIIYCIP
jgi:hypothetical protein